MQLVVEVHDPQLELHAVQIPSLRKYLSPHEVHAVKDVHN